jgi:hypothetical protein
MFIYHLYGDVLFWSMLFSEQVAVLVNVVFQNKLLFGQCYFPNKMLFWSMFSNQVTVLVNVVFRTSC